VLVGVARVDAVLEHLLQALMAPVPSRRDGLFLPDRPLGSLGAKVVLACRMGLIDAPVERALSALRKLRNAFAHSAESAGCAAASAHCLHRQQTAARAPAPVCGVLLLIRCSDAGEMLIAFCWPPLLCQGWGVMLRWSGGCAGPNCVLGAMYVNLLPGPL